ncbi:hypothetical protein ACL90Y_06020 [Micrococcus luteus]
MPFILPCARPVTRGLVRATHFQTMQRLALHAGHGPDRDHGGHGGH